MLRFTAYIQLKCQLLKGKAQKIMSRILTALKSIVSCNYRLHYKSNDLSSTPELIYGDGDGSVNLRSSQACTLWRGQQKQSISTLNVEKVEHFEILHNEQVVNYIKDLMIGD